MGDWIKLRLKMPTDPVVFRVADRLGVDRFAVAGRIVDLWTYASDHTEDGCVPLSVAILDERFALPGFCAALADEDWLILGENSVTIPEFDRFCSSAKVREKAREKKRKQRGRLSPGTRRGPKGDKRGTGGGRSPSPSTSHSLSEREGCRGEKTGSEFRAPDDLELTPERRGVAERLGVTDERHLAREWGRFKLHEFTRGVSDWDAEWERWVLNFDPGRIGGGGKGGGAARGRTLAEQNQDELARWRKRRAGGES